ncbi:copper transporter [Gordonia sp. VNK21]|uniref:copper transporter n=1 Tax=Gordonia sp. VNK21 TaxID=3382483 RepID=UPI0038D371F2
MISMRQHAISLIAVFLALAVGLFLGSGFIGDQLNSLTGTDRNKLSKLQDERDDLSRRVNQDGAFIGAVSPRLVDGLLKGKSVLVVTAPDAGEADVQELKGLLNDAGAGYSGQIALTDTLVKDGDAAKLSSIIDQTIPTGQQLRVEYTDSGSRLGDLLGTALLTREGQKAAGAADRSTVLQSLRTGGFIDYADRTVEPADLLLVVTGGSLGDDAGAQGMLVGRLAVAMATHARGGVLAGRDGSAQGGAAIAAVRGDTALGNALSTVDDVQDQIGRTTVVLALDEEANGRSGAYGTGPGATAITVGAEQK